MPGRLVRKTHKNGDIPLITVRFPKDHARALRLHASAKGEPLQTLIRELVAQWLAVNGTVHAPHMRDTREHARQVAIPQTQETRENTGRNASIRTLTEIDRTRKNAPRGATMRD